VSGVSGIKEKSHSDSMERIPGSLCSELDFDAG